MKLTLSPCLTLPSLALLVTGIAATGGCGATTLPTVRAPIGLALAANRTLDRPGTGVEAFGLPQHAHAVASATPDVAPYLQGTASVARTRGPSATVSAKASVADAAVARKDVSVPTFAKPQVAPPAAAPIASTQVAVEQRYAARDGVAQQQKEFRGGDAIVITAGTVVLVLLILLLVLLLT